MIPAAISLLLAILIAVKVKGSWSCFAFVASLLLILPLVAYTVTGLQMVLSEMSGRQVLQDCVSIAAQCYAEPFKLVSPSVEGGAGLNPSFTVMGFLVIAGTVISMGQFFVWISHQRQNPEVATLTTKNSRRGYDNR